MLVHEYELFKMFPSESITSMFTRMTIITNSLDALGRTYTKAKIISKILRSLLKTYEEKVMVVRETKDLTKLLLEELIDSLMTHKIAIKKQEQ
jgi:predicted flavoprotein YhiN